MCALYRYHNIRFFKVMSYNLQQKENLWSDLWLISIWKTQLNLLQATVQGCNFLLAWGSVKAENPDDWQKHLGCNQSVKWCSKNDCRHFSAKIYQTYAGSSYLNVKICVFSLSFLTVNVGFRGLIGHKKELTGVAVWCGKQWFDILLRSDKLFTRKVSMFSSLSKKFAAPESSHCWTCNTFDILLTNMWVR